LGGIDSILSTIEKTQKLVQTISPFLPLLVSIWKKKKRIPAKLKRLKPAKFHTVKKTIRPISNSRKKKLLGNKARPKGVPAGLLLRYSKTTGR
jgi:hypothetical protein